jgi:hypothetical protein
MEYVEVEYRTHPAAMLADDNPWNNPTGFMTKYGRIVGALRKF